MEVFLPLPMKPTIINVYLVRAGRGLDADRHRHEHGDERTRLPRCARRVGIAPATSCRIVGTHHHIDHYGTSGPFRDLTHAEVYLHPLEAERATAMQTPRLDRALTTSCATACPTAARPPLPAPSLFFGNLVRARTPDHLLADEDEIPLGDGRPLRVVWTPGHTPGHCCLLLEPDGILFVGDHLLPKITPHVGLWPNGPENPLGDFLASHERIQKRRRAPRLSRARPASTRTTAGARAS